MIRMNVLKVSMASVAIAGAFLVVPAIWNGESSAINNTTVGYWDGMMQAPITISIAEEKLTLPERFEFAFAESYPAYQPLYPVERNAQLIKVGVPIPKPRPVVGEPLVDPGEPITWVVVNDTDKPLTSLFATGVGSIRNFHGVDLLAGYKNGVAPSGLAVFSIQRELKGCGTYAMIAVNGAGDARARTVDVCATSGRRTPLSSFTVMPNLVGN